MTAPIHSFQTGVEIPSGEARAISENPTAILRRLQSEKATLEAEVQRLRATLLPRSEEALRESEERFRLLAENTRDLVCLHGSDGEFVYASPSCEELLGYTPKEVLGMRLSQFCHPDDRTLLQKNASDVVRYGRAITRLVYRIRRKDGRYVWFESETVPIQDANRPHVRFLISSRDVTERKRMEVAFTSRAKELNCLLQMAQWVEQHRHSLDTILQKVAEHLPDSWQHAHLACARITYGDRQYQSSNHRRSLWRQRAEIVLDGRPVGAVEIGYRRKMPPADEGPFTWEERRLLNAVAERLAGVIQQAQAEQLLLKERKALHESNIAMRELMSRIQEEKHEIAQAIQRNVDTLILPALETLREQVPRKHRKAVSLLMDNLEEITSPFLDKVSLAFQSLSPAELRICDMIRRGLANKEIAHLLHISLSTVNRHREHIRRKLGLTNTNTNLASHLHSLLPHPQAKKIEDIAKFRH